MKMTIFSYAAKLSLQIIFLVIRALLPPYCHLPNCFLLLSIRIIHTMGLRLSSLNFGPNADWCI